MKDDVVDLVDDVDVADEEFGAAHLEDVPLLDLIVRFF